MGLSYMNLHEFAQCEADKLADKGDNISEVSKTSKRQGSQRQSLRLSLRRLRFLLPTAEQLLGEGA